MIPVRSPEMSVPRRKLLTIVAGLAAIAVAVASGVALWSYITLSRTVIQTVDTSLVAEAPAVRVDDIAMGAPDAPVTVFEYYSLSCPHCAHFHEDILPLVKAAYIDTGKVRWVMRDYPLNGPALQAALLAHCVGGDGFWGMLDILFRSQRTWLVEDALSPLAALASAAGIDQARFNQCIGDRHRSDQIMSSRREAADNFQINAVPTFLIGKEKISGAREFEVMRQLIDQQLATKD